ncbi:1-aminocyclopropane-1-carboxylate deaminase/D-cysteine desulfhydrase [Shewanella donghaensis]|uniref:1-aminocyclopropane-1-carboxylate deaminase/D-cysteine desulfhydrase n=1 Tax=Shewanella donghaensis TaxID=238836 RepID=UPI0011834D26|nr:1-aminocyclopropane-1-carboxylate deaminase/D-cysteine desulfhydrase [Shewanella donghaensis]
MFATTPVQTIQFANRTIFVKRDDLIHPDFSGNKARKFQYFLEQDFPGVTKVVGYGSAQANSLHSLAVLAKLRGWALDYYVDHIAGYLKLNPQANYKAALNNGANIIEKPADIELSLEEYVQQYIQAPIEAIKATALNKQPIDESIVFVPEGGRCEYAQVGLDQLGLQIIEWLKHNNLNELDLFLPSGTGTTAVYLQRFFVEYSKTAIRFGSSTPNVTVLTCSCVGGDDYLTKQFYQLTDNTDYHPRIISNGKKFHFGKLNRQCYEMWQRVNKEGIEFELLYDPVGFIMLEHYLCTEKLINSDAQRTEQTNTEQTNKEQTHCDNVNNDNVITGDFNQEALNKQALNKENLNKDNSQSVSVPVMYLHQGGLLGNPSMLARYKRKYDL